MEVGEVNIQTMQKIKEAFDPNAVLNPAKIFLEEGQRDFKKVHKDVQ